MDVPKHFPLEGTFLPFDQLLLPTIKVTENAVNISLAAWPTVDQLSRDQGHIGTGADPEGGEGGSSPGQI